MDIITQSHFNDFRELYGYSEDKESDAFELFIIFCVLSKYIKSETITKEFLENIKIGAGGDWGIDGIIVIANGKVISTKEEVDDLYRANSYLSISIILVQAKTSDNFKVAELGQTLDGAENIIRDVKGESVLPASNDFLNEYREIVKHIYSYSAHFKDGKNPTLSVYYATCGDYNNQDDFIAKIDKSSKFINSSDLTSKFDCIMLGKKEIVQIYKETKTSIEASINVEQKITMPTVEQIDESYLCLLPFCELKKLIIDDEGRLIDSVFHDNVRAFQGDNIVNRDIAKSIREGNIALFSAMNNGLTIIAKTLRTTGNTIHLTDYQIVNGCQTCNVLQQNMNDYDIDKLILSVKLIGSSNKEIKDKIIVANNSQTEVKREQLVSLLEVQDRIEDYYNAQNKFDKLYYERRAKQYRFGEIRVPQDKIITIPIQITSFIAMILGKPEKLRGYYGRIVEQFKENGVDVFLPNTNPAFYFTSALAYYKLTEMFSKGVIHHKYKKIKYHVLLSLRLFCEQDPIPPLSSNKSQNYCDSICSLLSNASKCEIAFKGAIKLIETTLKREPVDRDRSDGNFTRKLMETTAILKNYKKN